MVLEAEALLAEEEVVLVEGLPEEARLAGQEAEEDLVLEEAEFHNWKQ